MKRIFSFTFIMALLVLSSCQKSESLKKAPAETLQLKTQPLSIETIKQIAAKLKGRGLLKENSANQSVNTLGKQTQVSFLMSPNPGDDEIAEITGPLVTNGRTLHIELMASIVNTPEWDELTETEKGEMQNLTDQQAAELSFNYAVAKVAPSVYTVIHDCVGVALGLRGIGSLFAGLTATPTLGTAIGLLKFLGRHYLSWIGIAWMVWDFSNCVSDFM
jgi:hypothetical protein